MLLMGKKRNFSCEFRYKIYKNVTHWICCKNVMDVTLFFVCFLSHIILV